MLGGLPRTTQAAGPGSGVFATVAAYGYDALRRNTSVTDSSGRTESVLSRDTLSQLPTSWQRTDQTVSGGEVGSEATRSTTRAASRTC